MSNVTSGKRWFLRTALAYLGTPYIWGGDDPSGFDCSGLVVECLKSVGLLKESEDLTADGLYRRFEKGRIELPRQGALLFYLGGSGKATHVVICLDGFFQIGASGGGATNIDFSIAWHTNAYVKIRPIRFNPTKMAVLYPF